MCRMIILNVRFFLVEVVFSLVISVSSSHLRFWDSFVLDCSLFPGLGTTSLPLLLFPPVSIKAALLCKELLLLLGLGDYPHLGVHSMNLYHDLFVLSLWLSLA